MRLIRVNYKIEGFNGYIERMSGCSIYRCPFGGEKFGAAGPRAENREKYAFARRAGVRDARESNRVYSRIM